MHYRSSASLLGLPLVHVAIGAPDGSDAKRGVARGWIAVGDISFGVVLSVGGLAAGGISVGGLSLGILSLAGVSLGIWSVGGLPLGLFAVGGGAIAVWAAEGGLAVACEYAIGGLALGRHANTDVARAYLASSPFFDVALRAMRHARWLPLLAAVVPIGLALSRWSRRKRTAD